MEDGEKIIKKTSEGWSAILKNKKKAGSMILTDKRIIIGHPSVSISLNDIVEIDLEPQFSDIPKISITCSDRTEYIEFYRHSLGYDANIFFGEMNFSFAESQAYTAYWASVLTMAAFLYGQNYGKVKEVKLEDSRARGWCPNCLKYISVPWTDESEDSFVLNMDAVTCPECGNKGMMSHNPEDKWCSACQKYVSVPRTGEPVWQLACPECGRKGLISQNPEEKKRNLDKATILEAPTSVSTDKPADKPHVDELYSGNIAWCANCKKYVPVTPSTKPIWKLKCPECRAILISKSPDDTRFF